MSERLTVIFDGQVLRPEVPLDLKPNTRYEITIRESVDRGEQDAWETLAAEVGAIEAPSDWSINHDHYLYGASLDNQDKSD